MPAITQKGPESSLVKSSSAEDMVLTIGLH